MGAVCDTSGKVKRFFGVLGVLAVKSRRQKIGQHPLEFTASACETVARVAGAGACKRLEVTTASDCLRAVLMDYAWHTKAVNSNGSAVETVP